MTRRPCARAKALAAALTSSPSPAERRGGREKAADVAAHLEQAARAAEDARQARGLGGVGGALGREEVLEHRTVGRFAGVGVLEHVVALARVAVDQAAAGATHHLEWRVLREGDAVEQVCGRRVGPEPRAVELPERFHLVADRVGVRHRLAAFLAADGAGHDLVRDLRHPAGSWRRLGSAT